MQASKILNLLLNVSSKASKIASIIRSEKPLVELLVEEKQGIEKNDRFVQDFKTLADVLIQETVRHYVSVEIPDIGASIYGEESNKFTNVQGETITVKICSSCDETEKLLVTVLNGNAEAAALLATAVHSEATSLTVQTEDVPVSIPIEDCGIWIDPIDSTGQYIKGKLGEENEYGMFEDGLQCVAILIGLFEKSTGKPILGVVVQPFAKFISETESWTSRTIWGVSFNGLNKTSFEPTSEASNTEARIVLSKSESEQVQKALSTKYKLDFASGAGYKLLATVLGLSRAYVLSHRSIYRWDCCAIHPILRAVGGGIVSYKHTLQAARYPEGELTEEDLHALQVSYTKASGAIRNRRNSFSDKTESLPGIIAYRSAADVLDILNLLK